MLRWGTAGIDGSEAYFEVIKGALGDKYDRMGRGKKASKTTQHLCSEQEYGWLEVLAPTWGKPGEK